MSHKIDETIDEVSTCSLNGRSPTTVAPYLQGLNISHARN